METSEPDRAPAVEMFDMAKCCWGCRQVNNKVVKGLAGKFAFVSTVPTKNHRKGL